MVPSPRWLDESEQRSWRAYLRARRLLDEALERDLQQFGVSLPEYEIISLLSEVPQRHLRMSTLADRVVQSRSRLTHTATRLEGRGWVERRRATCDRRGVELWLTEEGWAAVQGLAPVHVDSVGRHLIDHLTPEQFANVGEAMAAIGDGILAQRATRVAVS